MPRLVKTGFSLWLIIIFFILFCPALKAEEETYRRKLGSVVTIGEETVTHELDSYVRYMPTRSLCDQPGKISLIKSASEYSYSFKLFGQLPIELAIGGADIDINANDAVPVTLPSHLTELVFGAEATLPFFNLDKTYFRFGITPSFYSDDWNFKANSFNFGSHALLIYQPSEKLTLVAGVAASPGFEDPITPFAGLIYVPNDRLTFNLIPSRPTISYKINEQITIFGEGGFSGAEFKVTKDNLKSAALSYNEVHFGAGIEFTINKYVSAYLSCGRMFNHYLEYRDSLGKVDMKNNTYSELRIEVGI